MLAELLGLRVLTWRAVPRNNSCLGSMAVKTEPEIYQVFVVPGDGADKADFGKQTFMLRKMATHR